jgi:hypothetical protein
MVVNQKLLNCEQVWREVSNYVDGEVDAALRATMDEHFKTCKRCASVLAGTRNVVQLYGDERMLEVPAGFSGRLENRLAKNVSGQGVRGKKWSSWSAWLAPAAAMALIAGGVLLTNSLTHGRFSRSHHAVPATNIPPDLQVVVSSGSKLFHVPGCRFIHDKATERTLTAKEAMQEGYVPCTRCLRQYLKTALMHQAGAQVAETDAEDDEVQGKLSSVAGH